MSITKRAEEKRLEKGRATCNQWNLAHPIGTLVDVVRDDGSVEQRKTRSEAWPLGHGEPVVLLEGISGGYMLSRCTPALGEQRSA